MIEIKPVQLESLGHETLVEVKHAFERVARPVLDACSARGVSARQGVVTPVELVASLDKFFEAFERLDTEYGARGALPVADAPQLIDHAQGCLMDLYAWLGRLDQDDLELPLNRVVIGLTLWAMNHDVQLATPAPVVNALAVAANGARDRREAAAVFGVMQGVHEHLRPALKADPDKPDPERPWRILNLNLAITAIRCEDEAMMRYAFDALESNLPDECAGFFEEAKAVAAHPKVAAHVRDRIVERAAKWTRMH